MATDPPAHITEDLDHLCPPTGKHWLAYPDDRTKFIVCIDGTANVVDCPPGYEYNPEFKTCRLVPDEDDIVVVELEAEGESDAGDRQDSSARITGDLDYLCPAEGMVYREYPDDPTKYIFCKDGTAYDFDCPANTEWNPEVNACMGHYVDGAVVLKPEAEGESDAGDRKDPSARITGDLDYLCPATGTILRGYPDDLTKFIMCIDGTAHAYDCPANTKWDPAREICDVPHPDDGIVLKPEVEVEGESDAGDRENPSFEL
ncbi:MAG: hypothetical protein Q9208_001917 [Pyrenodesmia sp. 3 TL-2023]